MTFDQQRDRVIPGRGMTAIVILMLMTGCASLLSNDSGTLERHGEAWYMPDWARSAPLAPNFLVRDTESSLGPYADRTKTIGLQDLVKMHGHLCDGLVLAACAAQTGLGALYPDGVIDRTDTGCITNNSPCLGDAAAYLTGGRVRFGTQKVDPHRANSFVFYRFTTGEAVEVSLKPGSVPSELTSLEAMIRAGRFTPDDLRRCRELQDEFARRLLSMPREAYFEIQRIDQLVWVPDAYEHAGPRGDIVNRNVKLPRMPTQSHVRHGTTH